MHNYRKLRLAAIGNDETIRFAVDEFYRYLKLIDPGLHIDVMQLDKFAPTGDAPVIWIGEDESFSSFLPQVGDREYDDGVYISIERNNGIITGTNKRSVLLAVYFVLKELGISWVRPGADGEIIIKKEIDSIDVSCSHAASYRTRGICIEGAASYETVIDVLDWLPKAAMNGYYLQYFHPKQFLDRWHKHYNNPYFEDEEISEEQSHGFLRRFESEIRKRDLIYHAVGHGWTAEPFGLNGSTLNVGKGDIPLSEEQRQCLAMVQGKRELWGNIPLATNLCYSNRFVRKTLVDAVVAKCEEKRDISYLHFWLGDGLNNMCECEECIKTKPVEFYVSMLNEIDAELTSRGIGTKIVFLIYFDLMWTPEIQKIKNPDRFSLMFAPITRVYTKTYDQLGEMQKPAPYVYNKLIMPQSVEENVAYLREWQSIYPGDCFLYDYHLMWDHFYDPGYYQTAKTVFTDMVSMGAIGLNGMMSCQMQRIAFPTGFPAAAMAAALWDKDSCFEKAAAAYYTAAFGEDGLLVLDYTKQLSELFVPNLLRGLSLEGINVLEKLTEAGRVVERFSAVIERNIKQENPNVAKSWRYLKLHGVICKYFARALIGKYNHDSKTAKENWTIIEEFITKNELELFSVLDVYEYIEVLKGNVCEGEKVSVEIAD